jgi:hypothetical protein
MTKPSCPRCGSLNTDILKKMCHDGVHYGCMRCNFEFKDYRTTFDKTWDNISETFNNISETFNNILNTKKEDKSVFLSTHSTNWNFENPYTLTIKQLTKEDCPNWTISSTDNSIVKLCHRGCGHSFTRESAFNAAKCPSLHYISVQSLKALTETSSTTMTTNVTFPVSATYKFHLYFSFIFNDSYNDSTTEFAFIINGVQLPSFKLLKENINRSSSSSWHLYTITYPIEKSGTYPVSLKVINTGNGTGNVDVSTICFADFNVSYISQD